MKMKNNAIFEPKLECADKKTIQKIQLKKFNKVLSICRKSSLYSKINLPKKINNLKEVRKIPFTTKQMLRNSYPYGSLCVDKNRVIEIHTSSGTTGNPTIMFLTKKDLEISNKVLARTWFCNGIRKEDIFMMMGDYGLFTGGLLNHYALTYIGTMVIPIGVSSSEKQIIFLKDFKVTATAGIASHYFRIIEKMKEMGIKAKDLNLRIAVAAGEPYSEKTRKYFEKEFNCKFMDQYGLAEINTGLAGECEYRCGLHIPHDYVYPEIIDPKTGEVLEDGEVGELVLTTLDREANPVIRYRTGDITSINHEKCKCGRTTPRIDRIKGRVDDIVFVKGIKLYPNFLESVLWEMKRIIKPETWSLKIERKKGLDELTLFIKPNGKKEGKIKEKLKAKLKERIGIRFNISFNAINNEGHKTKRVIDKRN